MPTEINLYEKVMIRSCDNWFEGCVTDSIYVNGVSFLIVDYVDTNMIEIAQAIVNVTYISMCVRMGGFR